jgi:hypothetical protein
LTWGDRRKRRIKWQKSETLRPLAAYTSYSPLILGLSEDVISRYRITEDGYLLGCGAV